LRVAVQTASAVRACSFVLAPELLCTALRRQHLDTYLLTLAPLAAIARGRPALTPLRPDLTRPAEGRAPLRLAL
jgi:hypothetical protein